MSSLPSRLYRWTPWLVMALSIALWFGRAAVFYPGDQTPSAACISDLSDETSRHGHSEEVLWRGCLIASDTQHQLARFIPPSRVPAPSCLSCHEGRRAPNFAEMWTRFPRFNAAKGRVEDFAQAIQDEIALRYGGLRPNRADNAITALYYYAAAKAHQDKRLFQVDTPGASAFRPDGEDVSADCQTKFVEKGWPTGSNAVYVVRGCNLITETGRFLSGPIARRWDTGLVCQSCHLGAGDKANAASLAAGAVMLPHMMTSMNQPIRFDRRVLMCFARSLNWYDIGLDAPEIAYINLYSNWLAQKNGLVIGETPTGRGVPLLYDAMGRGASFLAGERVYQDYCRACHGPNGLGGAGVVEVIGKEPPPVSGPRAFNRSASLSDPYRLAGFAHANMPPGATLEHPVLSHQQALDVAMYLVSMGRPADFTQSNQIQIFGNYLWVRGVVTLGQWLGQFQQTAGPTR